MRYELTDFEWAAIRPFLPNKPRGIPQVDDRRVLNGISWVLRSVHAVVDTNGLLVHLALTPGEAHDNRLCSVLVNYTVQPMASGQNYVTVLP
jgi:transposase